MKRFNGRKEVSTQELKENVKLDDRFILHLDASKDIIS